MESNLRSVKHHTDGNLIGVQRNAAQSYLGGYLLCVRDTGFNILVI
jgi:hypothetical protein